MVKYFRNSFFAATVILFFVDATKGDENRSANIEEESQVIRSPFVAGAVHEECKWFDMEEAKEISTIFLEIHNTPEFQKLMAKLKGIVSAM